MYIYYMYMCVYIYIYMYMHMHISISLSLSIYIYIYICIHPLGFGYAPVAPPTHRSPPATLPVHWGGEVSRALRPGRVS